MERISAKDEILSPRKIAIGFQEGACPLKCKKCWAFGQGKKNHVRKMRLEQAKGLIDEISALPSETLIHIQPHVQAEPFTNSDFREIVEYCMVKNVGMSIVTNGILTDESWRDFIAEKLDGRFQISFSLDAVTQETYEKVRGNYSLQKIEETVLYLLEHRKPTYLVFFLNFFYYLFN